MEHSPGSVIYEPYDGEGGGGDTWLGDGVIMHGYSCNLLLQSLCVSYVCVVHTLSISEIINQNKRDLKVFKTNFIVPKTIENTLHFSQF
jgi:hypothetical protein